MLEIISNDGYYQHLKKGCPYSKVSSSDLCQRHKNIYNFAKYWIKAFAGDQPFWTFLFQTIRGI